MTNTRYLLNDQEEDLFLVTELCTGGELFYYLSKTRFSEHLARFYFAEVLVALSHLH